MFQLLCLLKNPFALLLTSKSNFISIAYLSVGIEIQLNIYKHTVTELFEKTLKNLHDQTGGFLAFLSLS